MLSDLIPAAFLETAARGRIIATHLKKEVIFVQGDVADSVFYIRKGKVKVTVVSAAWQGSRRLSILGVDEFIGEGCLIGQPRRLATATAMTDCETMRVQKAEIVRVLQDEPTFSQMFIAHILARNARVEEDLGRSALQLDRKAPRPRVVVVGEFRQGRRARSRSLPRSARKRLRK